MSWYPPAIYVCRLNRLPNFGCQFVGRSFVRINEKEPITLKSIHRGIALISEVAETVLYHVRACLLGQPVRYDGGHKRDPYPKTIVFEPVRSYKRLFAWVELPLGCGVSWICATCDKKTNRIAVTTRGGSKGFRIYLNTAKMINLRKPVTVTVNGKEAFSGYVQRSAAAVVRSIAALRDTQRYFDAVIAVD